MKKHRSFGYCVLLLLMALAQEHACAQGFEENLFLPKPMTLSGMAAASDGKIVLTSSYFDAGAGVSRLQLIQLTAQGQVEWCRSSSGIGLSHLGSPSVLANNDIAYLALTDSGIALSFVTAEGVLRSRHTYTISTTVQPGCYCLCADGGYIVSGRGSYGSEVAQFLVRVGADGNMKWAKRFIDLRTHDQGVIISTVAELPDGSIIAAGSKSRDSSKVFARELLTIRLRPDGTIIRMTGYFDLLHILSPTIVAPLSNGGYALGGEALRDTINLAESMVAFFDSNDNSTGAFGVHFLTNQMVTSLYARDDGSVIAGTRTLNNTTAAQLLIFAADHQVSSVSELFDEKHPLGLGIGIPLKTGETLLGGMFDTAGSSRLHVARINPSFTSCGLSPTLVIVTPIDLHQISSILVDTKDTSIAYTASTPVLFTANIPAVTTICKNGVAPSPAPSLTISPNPIRSGGSVAIEGRLPSGLYSIVLRDILGKVLSRMTIEASAGHWLLPTESIIPGTYTIEIVDRITGTLIYKPSIIIQ